MWFIIKRFEKGNAVCLREDDEIVEISRQKIPSGARRGDVLEAIGDAMTIKRTTDR